MPTASLVTEDVHSATAATGRPDDVVVDVLDDQAGFAQVALALRLGVLTPPLSNVRRGGLHAPVAALGQRLDQRSVVLLVVAM